jgi:hypothetical protein
MNLLGAVCAARGEAALKRTAKMAVRSILQAAVTDEIPELRVARRCMTTSM